MSNRQIAMDYLMAILNDTCLQVWSGAYARYFWYGIATVIGVFALARILKRSELSLRYVTATLDFFTRSQYL